MPHTLVSLQLVFTTLELQRGDDENAANAQVGPGDVFYVVCPLTATIADLRYHFWHMAGYSAPIGAQDYIVAPPQQTLDVRHFQLNDALQPLKGNVSGPPRRFQGTLLTNEDALAFGTLAATAHKPDARLPYFPTACPECDWLPRSYRQRLPFGHTRTDTADERSASADAAASSSLAARPNHLQKFTTDIYWPGVAFNNQLPYRSPHWITEPIPREGSLRSIMHRQTTILPERSNSDRSKQTSPALSTATIRSLRHLDR